MEGEGGVEEGVMRKGVESPFLPTLGLLTLLLAAKEDGVASQSI